MKGPSLQRTAAFSAVLHLTVFFAAVLILKLNKNVVLPSPYEVSLVHDVQTNSAGGHRESAKPDKTPSPDEKNVIMDEKNSKPDDKRVEDMVSVIEAKKRLERFARLKSAMVSIKGSERKGQNKTSQSASGPSGVSYEEKIRDEIHRQWAWPDTGRKDLEAIVVITIRKDGTILVGDIQWEKKSESRLFNNSALQAIANASPVTPPPHEMEIGIRFYP